MVVLHEFVDSEHVTLLNWKSIVQMSGLHAQYELANTHQELAEEDSFKIYHTEPLCVTKNQNNISKVQELGQEL